MNKEKECSSVEFSVYPSDLSYKESSGHLDYSACFQSISKQESNLCSCWSIQTQELISVSEYLRYRRILLSPINSVSIMAIRNIFQYLQLTETHHLLLVAPLPVYSPGCSLLNTDTRLSQFRSPFLTPAFHVKPPIE